MPGVQYPHCAAPSSAKACCRGCSVAPLAIPSMVVIARPSSWIGSSRQLSSGLPSTRTVHVPAQNLEERLVHRQQHLDPIAVHVQRHHMAVDGTLYLVPQGAPSIVLSASAQAQRSGATASARLDDGTGSSGWTRMARIPSASAGRMSFSSLLPMTTQRPGSAQEARIAISNTAG